MKEILIQYFVQGETINAITILYKKHSINCTLTNSPDGDTPFFEITTVVLQGDNLVPFICIYCLDYILKTSLDNDR